VADVVAHNFEVAARLQAVVPFPNGTNELIAVNHTRLKYGGGWSYFICPGCGGRSKKLWLIHDAPRCTVRLDKLGARYRSAYAFGRAESLRERDQRIDRLQDHARRRPAKPQACAVKPTPRPALRASVESCSIKKLAPLYDYELSGIGGRFRRSVPVRGDRPVSRF
jgi:hypothetical protein